MLKNCSTRKKVYKESQLKNNIYQGGQETSLTQPARLRHTSQGGCKSLKSVDINDEKNNKEEFEVTAIVESHQVKLPVPKKLMNIHDLEFKKGQKLKLNYDKKKKELKYKI